jgi:hypothetical protein
VSLAYGSPVPWPTVTIPAYERTKRGRKKRSADLPRIDVIHDLPEAEKVCAIDGAVARQCAPARIQCQGRKSTASAVPDVVPANVPVLGSPAFLPGPAPCPPAS